MSAPSQQPPVLYIVIPCYNEEAVLPETLPMFKAKLEQLSKSGAVAEDSRLLFVNDGSRDRTWEIITTAAERDNTLCGMCLSRNKGHQAAVMAGMMEARHHADIVITIDCDGQDDLNAMDGMVEAYAQGHDVVYGVRNDRDSDTFFKRFTAESFYRLMNSMGAEVVFNHADYRLLSKRVLEALSRYKEVNLFLRGVIPMIGFRHTQVYYKRQERLAGESHYPIRKMLALAFDGITSLSIRPIRLITLAGLFISLLSFIGIIWVFTTFFTGHAVPGWSSSTCIFCFLGGIQLISLGVIGEYVGKIYMETKERPRYIVQDRLNLSDRKN